MKQCIKTMITRRAPAQAGAHAMLHSPATNLGSSLRWSTCSANTAMRLKGSL